MEPIENAIMNIYWEINSLYILNKEYKINCITGKSIEIQKKKYIYDYTYKNQKPMKRLSFLTIFSVCFLIVSIKVVLGFGIVPIVYSFGVCFLITIIILLLAFGIGIKQRLCMIKNKIVAETVLILSFGMTIMSWSIVIGWEAYFLFYDIYLCTNWLIWMFASGYIRKFF